MRGKPSVESLKQIQNLVLATQIQNLAHRFRIEGKHSFNFLDSQSKQLTESSISKNLIKALPKINNEARQRSLAESKALKSLDSAIFAQQKWRNFAIALGLRYRAHYLNRAKPRTKFLKWEIA